MNSDSFLQDIGNYPSAPMGDDGTPCDVPNDCPLPEVCIAKRGPDGAIWVGGLHGVARCGSGEWRCFWGRRWLPENNVTDIRLFNRDAFLLTSAGWSRIERREMSLAEKAAHYQSLTEERHTRRGYVTRCIVRPGEDPPFTHRSVDNDGLWTAIYCVAQCFRFVVTGDPEAKRLADASLCALLELERVTGIPGFPARSVVLRDETDVVRTEGEWHPSPVETGASWKGDTSSDELSGHFFAYHIYHRLISSHPGMSAAAQRILDHLIKNDLQLIDADGLPTRWGDFSPASLNHDPAWRQEKGLNSLCILSFLLVGYQLSGREDYLALYHSLIDEHGYASNSVWQKMLPPYEVNHSDDQLAFLAFYCLLHGQDNPHPQFEAGLRKSFEVEFVERCPLFNLIALTAFPNEQALRDARKTLEEWPWDLRDWSVRNSHRTDIIYDKSPDRFGRRQLVLVLSPMERPVYRWNSNPFIADGGGDGSLEEDGSAWLIAYWLGRYHGLL
jgi:hypothetical protein